ncbi:hypothetical protein CPB83DRAFT_852910 [Crepidotus variabilis]|uniref:Uncharacterized protein n=1 Tax=Crepidotus variabilis TaxID=179855 RepID=A0A9P6JR62_9AGAR|nr:hypothetical protein CPB83DRAFT_852910 [Crepidotus variabilis]
MPHSTTGTTSYVLQKYSRAYPRKRSVSKSQTETQDPADVISEWQHFTNPTIRLVLEVKSTPSGGTESVRLRIIWQMGSEQDSSSNQQDFTFEDLDLLSFADMASNIPKTQVLEGLPLKAVYRDAVVGIRYLHNRELGEALAYRRVQISFQSSAEASEFIENIKPVCPCKMNPNPVQGTQRPPLANSRIQTIKPAPLVAKPTLPVITQNPPGPRFQQQALPVHAPFPMRPNQQGLPHISSDISYELESSPMRSGQENRAITLSHSGGPASSSRMQSHFMPPPPPPPFHEAPSHCTRLDPASSLPASSFSGSSEDLTQLRDNGAPSAAHATEPSDRVRTDNVRAFLSEVKEATSIYDLPTPALERLIGEILCEDGFLKMVEQVAEMITIRRVARV